MQHYSTSRQSPHRVTDTILTSSVGLYTNNRSMAGHTKTTDLDSNGRYLKGHVGYRRWFGNGPPKQTPAQRHAASPEPKPRVDRYMKGQEGYKRWYGEPRGPPKYKYAQ